MPAAAPWTVHCADNLAVLRALPDASIDSIVCDPPYEIDMMGRAWDGSGVAFEVARWAECLRVLRPGGYIIAFSSARTYHRLACAIEDAGAEIRDQLVWIYSTGFPKSPRDITAAIDRNRGDDPRPVCRWLRAAVEEQGRTPVELDALFGLAGMAGHWCATDRNTQPSIPTPEQWRRIVEFLAVEPPDDVAEAFAELTARKGQADEAWDARPVVGEHAKPAQAAVWRETYTGDGQVEAQPREMKSAAPTKAEASPWVGWATALRPSHEPAVLARKRFTGPTYRNVLAHGTGAINVDGCRLPMSDEDRERIAAMGVFGNADYVAGQGVSLSGSVDGSLNKKTTDAQAHPGGRWPPNVLLSETAAADLDAAVGERKSSGYNGPRGKGAGMGGWRVRDATGEERADNRPNGPTYGDSGGPSRFFYCDKASTTEREAGLEHLSVGPAWSDGRKKPADYASQRGKTDRRNIHPTVKPIDVMRWLVRLVTPPGGVVLDPYAGSGTTGIACVLEGFGFVGVDLDPAHVAIATARIQAAEDGAFRVEPKTGRVKVRGDNARRQTTLF